MGTKDHTEFKNAIHDIGQYAHKLDSSFDRVRCAEWVRKLTSLPDDDLEAVKIRNEYAQFLRIQNQLIPFPERLGDVMAKKIPDLPKAGPIIPVLHRRSPDGRAYVCAKQIPGGVLCYLAVSPDGLGLD